MDIVVWTYLVYIAISAGLTVWVGRTLYKNGALFLVDVFKGRKELASAVNHLLVVGFYLINFGYVTLTLKVSEAPATAQESVEALSTKVGAVLIALGVLHFGNLYVLNHLRSRAENAPRQRPMPPVPPAFVHQGQIPPA